MLSFKDWYETQIVELKINYDPTLQQLQVSYSFTQDPTIFPNNKGQVINIAEREEKRLVQAGFLESFNIEFRKLLEYGALNWQIQSWQCGIDQSIMSPYSMY